MQIALHVKSVESCSREAAHILQNCDDPKKLPVKVVQFSKDLSKDWLRQQRSHVPLPADAPGSQVSGELLQGTNPTPQENVGRDTRTRPAM
jgi:hypothetical protein